MVCKDAKRVCNCRICFGYKVVVEVPIMEEGMDRIKDLDVRGVGIGKGNGRLTIVVGAVEIEGGELEVVLFSLS